MTNAGWIDGAAMDGLRKNFSEEFSQIFIFNLRGNARTSGEIRQKESGNIFGEGSRAPIAITILVKNPAAKNKTAEIFYCDIGDYLTREEKLEKISRIKTVLSDEFKKIIPNEKNDWINQRGEIFDKFIPLGDKDKTEKIFEISSLGVLTSRDAFCYNFSKKILSENMQMTIDFYNENSPENVNPKKIVWSEVILKNKRKNKKIDFDAKKIVESSYRPFCKEFLYFDECFNERRSNMPKIFSNEKNFIICVTSVSSKSNFSVFISEKICDYWFTGNTKCFPLYYYEEEAGNLFEKMAMRRYGVSDWIEKKVRERYGISVKQKFGEDNFCITKIESEKNFSKQKLTAESLKEEIFYYVYGFLHLGSYREKFRAELKKSLPRIILVKSFEDFLKISEAGRRLAEIHLNYEKFSAPEGVEVEILAENYFVRKMKLSADKKILQYNEFVTIKNIPAKVFEYEVNGRSPVEWIIERYQIKIDKASGIENNPNKFCEEIGDEKYILKLLLSSMTVAIKTLEIVENLPDVEFE